MNVIRKNPETVAPPVGAYSHISIMPRDAELLVLSGQVGADAHGHIPESVEEQFQNALANVKRILQSEGVTPEAVLKINIWFTEKMDRERFQAIWHDFHGGNPPSTTLGYVAGLAQPALKVEVEAWAARG
ncbi:RidA family protein [Brevibacillus fluminis]|uniref:RidA family protein n=1 Tax=Brevibacillus fluminis TaxID=511487 RepID=UPI003F8AF48B